MDLQVSPDDIVAAGGRLAGDADLLRALALLTEAVRGAQVGAPAELAAAIGRFVELVPVAWRTLGLAAETLSRNLIGAGRSYGDAEDRAASMARGLVLG